MKRALPWILNLLLVATVIGVIIYVTRDDGEEAAPTRGATTTTSTTTTTEPPADATEYIADGPFREQLIGSLQRTGGVDMDLSEWDSDDWDLAQVRSISGNNMTIRSGSQVLLLFTDKMCDTELPGGYFGDLFDPGDWTLWNTYGDSGNDTLICEGEIVLVKEG